LHQGAFDAALLQDPVPRWSKSPGLPNAPRRAVVDTPLLSGRHPRSPANCPVRPGLARSARQTRAYQPQVLAITGTNGKTTVTAS
jgi:UDP-N-acetylmuramoylalanine-D-glutamate ligase